MPTATVVRRPGSKPTPRLLTVADLAVLPDELPSGAVRLELDNGRLVVMPPPGDIHGAVDSNICAQLKVQGEIPGHGKARSQVGIILWRDPDRVVGPDSVFLHKDQLPAQISKEGYLETIPYLVVEVRSKNDTRPEVRQKVRDYLKAGGRVIWVADPGKRTVNEYRPRKKPKLYRIGDTLAIEDVIPGFQMAVAAVFVI